MLTQTGVFVNFTQRALSLAAEDAPVLSATTRLRAAAQAGVV